MHVHTSAHVVDAFIEGQSHAPMSDRRLEIVDPSTGSVFGELADCGAEDIAAAVESSAHAFEKWRRVSPYDRGRTLLAIAHGIREEAAYLAELESKDVGKPLSQARADIELSARYFEFFGSMADKIYGETIPVNWETFGVTFREPVGVTAHISPWNYPILVASRSLAPALAAGNSCVLKPAEDASLTSIGLARIATAAGLPPGVLNVVPGVGTGAGALLSASPGIQHISFTGSPVVGSAIMRAASENWVPTSMELGGKSPNVVFADADLDAALPMILKVLIQNSGQTCSAGTRLLIQSNLHEQVVTSLTTALDRVTMGPGLDDRDMGPLISRRQQERVLAFIDRAVTDGATVRTGGREGSDDPSPGFFCKPTLVDGVDPGMEIATEEVFGPVLAVLPFDDVEDAINLANGTPYALAAGVWTRDMDKALNCVREIDAGQVYVNTYAVAQDVSLPFGGNKKSGFGREKGLEALHEYTKLKAVAFKSQPDRQV